LARRRERPRFKQIRKKKVEQTTMSRRFNPAQHLLGAPLAFVDDADPAQDHDHDDQRDDSGSHVSQFARLAGAVHERRPKSIAELAMALGLIEDPAQLHTLADSRTADVLVDACQQDHARATVRASVQSAANSAAELGQGATDAAR
jgi:hypothetical protein